MSGSRPIGTHDPRKARRNIILALAHVVLVLVILGCFVYVQSHS